MSYFAPYIDEYGAHIPSYNDILEYLAGDPDDIENNPGIFRQIYGMDIYLENDSQDYQFLSSLALLYYDCCQSFLFSYNNQSPSTAVGISLDRLVAINGLARKSATYSTVTLLLTGEPNTTLSYAQAKDVNGYIWQIPNNTLFNNSGSAQVIATCIIPGRIQAPSGTITQIATPIQNWYSVNNPLSAIPGSDIESDSALRERQKQSVGANAFSTLESMTTYLGSLNVVKKVKIYENDTDSSSGTFPAHTIAPVIDSSADTETHQIIAEAIYKKKAPGVGTYGSVSVDIETSIGLTNTINFTHPTPLTATVVLNITTLSGYTDSQDDDIKNSIIEYINGLDIGENLYITNLYVPILKNNDESSPSFYITALTVNSQSTAVSVAWNRELIVGAQNITINKTAGA